MLQQFDSTVSHAAAGRALLEIKEMRTGKGGSHEHTHTSTVTAGTSVTPQIVMRSLQPTQPDLEPGDWGLCSSKTEQSTACSSERPEVGMCYSLCVSTAADTEDGEPVTSHRATRSDSQTLIMVSTSCSRPV